MIVDNCPRCFDPVRIPDQLSGISKVRCPLCLAEYELSEALGHLPPALEVVDAPQLEPVRADPLVQPESSSRPPELDKSTAAEGSGPSFGFLNVDGDSPSPSESPRVAPADPPGAFQFNFEAASSSPAGEEGSTSSAARPNERKSDDNGMMIVKIILGGIGGVVIAFFAILWLPFFPDNDLFGGAKYLPDFLVPAHVRDSSGAVEDPAPKENTEQTNSRYSNPRASRQTPRRTPVPREDNHSRFRPPVNARESDHPFGLRLPPDHAGTSESVSPETPNDSEENSPFQIGSEVVVDSQPDIFDLPKPDILDLGPELPPEDDFIGIRDAPSYEPTALGQAYRDAMIAKRAWNHSDSISNDERRILGTEFYESLCEMAEIITFVDASDPSVGNHCDAVIGLLLAIGEDDTDYRLAGILGERQFVATDRSTPGIVIAGAVVGIEKEGELYNTRVELVTPGEAKQICSIMSRINPLEPPTPQGQNPKPAYQVGSRVLICGSIINLPEIRLGGYEGSEPTVIWGGFPVEIESP